MGIVSLNDRRKPVIYTVNITHHWDDSFEVFVEGVSDDPRSRAAVGETLRRAASLFEPDDTSSHTETAGGE